MAAQVVDGVIVTMGYSPEGVTYVRSETSESCAEIGPDPKEV